MTVHATVIFIFVGTRTQKQNSSIQHSPNKECDVIANSYNLNRIIVSNNITLTLNCYVMSSATPDHHQTMYNEMWFRWQLGRRAPSIFTISVAKGNAGV